MASGELSQHAGLHPNRAPLSLGFLTRFIRDEGMLVLMDLPEQAGDRGVDRAGAELGTCHALSGRIPGEIHKGSFSHLCALLL